MELSIHCQNHFPAEDNTDTEGEKWQILCHGGYPERLEIWYKTRHIWLKLSRPVNLDKKPFLFFDVENLDVQLGVALELARAGGTEVSNQTAS